MSTGEKSFGPYTLHEMLGKGARAAVFKARQAELDRELVIKVYSKESGLDAQSWPPFEKKLLASMGVAHPNLVRVLAAGELGGVFYVAMDPVDGVSLRKLIDSHAPLDGRFVVPALQGLASGLEALHLAGQVHGSVNAANIWLNHAGEFVLSDPAAGGLVAARVLDRLKQDPARVTSVSPETAAGQPAKEPADLYALGILAYEMLTKKLPYDTTQPNEWIQKLKEKAPPVPLRQRDPNQSESMERVVMALLSPQPDQRPSAAELLQLLDVLAVDCQVTGEPIVPDSVKDFTVKPARGRPGARGGPARRGPGGASASGRTVAGASGRMGAAAAPPKPAGAGGFLEKVKFWHFGAALGVVLLGLFAIGAYLSYGRVTQVTEVPKEEPKADPSPDPTPAPKHPPLTMLRRELVATDKKVHFRAWTPEAVQLEVTLTPEKKDPKVASDATAGYWHRLDFDVEPGVSYKVTYQSKKDKRGFHPEREWAHVPLRKALEDAAADTIIKMNAITELFQSAGKNDSMRVAAYHRVLTRMGTWRNPFFWCEEEASRNVLDNQFALGVERSRRRSLHDLVGSRGAAPMLELLKKKLAPPPPEGDQPVIELAPEVPDLIRALAMSGDKASLEAVEDFLGKLAPKAIQAGPPAIGLWWETLDEYARYQPQRVSTLGKKLGSSDSFAAKFLTAVAPGGDRTSLMTSLTSSEARERWAALRAASGCVGVAAAGKSLLAWSQARGKVAEEEWLGLGYLAVQKEGGAERIAKIAGETSVTSPMATWLMGQAGSSGDPAVLVKTLDRPDDVGRMAAVRALSLAGLRRGPGIHEVGAGALEALGKVKAPAGHAALLELARASISRKDPDKALALHSQGPSYARWLAGVAYLAGGGDPAKLAEVRTASRAPPDPTKPPIVPLEGKVDKLVWRDLAALLKDDVGAKSAVVAVIPHLGGARTGLEVREGDQVRIRMIGAVRTRPDPGDTSEEAKDQLPWTLDVDPVLWLEGHDLLDTPDRGRGGPWFDQTVMMQGSGELVAGARVGGLPDNDLSWMGGDPGVLADPGMVILRLDIKK